MNASNTAPATQRARSCATRGRGLAPCVLWLLVACGARRPRRATQRQKRATDFETRALSRQRAEVCGAGARTVSTSAYDCLFRAPQGADRLGSKGRFDSSSCTERNHTMTSRCRSCITVLSSVESLFRTIRRIGLRSQEDAADDVDDAEASRSRPKRPQKPPTQRLPPAVMSDTQRSPGAHSVSAVHERRRTCSVHCAM